MLHPTAILRRCVVVILAALVLLLAAPGVARVREPNNIYADRKSTRLNSSHIQKSRMPSSA